MEKKKLINTIQDFQAEFNPDNSTRINFGDSLLNSMSA